MEIKGEGMFRRGFQGKRQQNDTWPDRQTHSDTHPESISPTNTQQRSVDEKSVDGNKAFMQDINEQEEKKKRKREEEGREKTPRRQRF